jgi:phosphoribosyl 1,2-cyclic phosphate phosphodiesterase
MRRLEDLDTLILGALRWERHSTHFSVPEALEVVRRLKPRRTWLTHISHQVAHAETDALLPHGVRLAYDGLSFSVGDPGA